MDEIDDLTREKLREWQVRRLEIKEQMQSHPEKTLELSGVLDCMDEEHAAILRGATRKQNTTPDHAAIAHDSQRPVAGQYQLKLQVTAHSPEDLRKLLELAVHELQGQIAATSAAVAGERNQSPGSMSGTLGEYHFELGINGETSHA